MCTRTPSGPASRCGRSPGNQAPPDDSDRKAVRREARTFAKKMAVRATEELSARLLARLLYKRWRGHLSALCDKKSGVPQFVLFCLRPVIELIRASKQSTPRGSRTTLNVYWVIAV